MELSIHCYYNEYLLNKYFLYIYAFITVLGNRTYEFLKSRNFCLHWVYILVIESDNTQDLNEEIFSMAYVIHAKKENEGDKGNWEHMLQGAIQI